MAKTEMEILVEQESFFKMQRDLCGKQIAEKKAELQELTNKQVAYDGAAQGVRGCIERIEKEKEEPTVPQDAVPD